MKSKNYVIVDDSIADAGFLKQQLDLVPFLELFKICSSVEEVIEVLINQKIDLLFLDIKLSGQSGLDLLKFSPELPPVIIVSAYPEYAIESYEIGRAADYLLKPFTYERLLIGLNRALSIQIKPTSIAEPDFIFLKMGRKIQRFDYKSIEYVEAYGIYSKVICSAHTYTVNERLVTLTELLPDQLFMRVHKSYLINITKITSYDRNYLWLGQLKIPIGISFRPKLEGLLRLFNRLEEYD
ncbi:LytR/AlgR family response regulator transcription factor [Spirosoma validum]|uniref:Response regulator transcription factor n=1 Tax=Spirosoma validum TaxID=2771355 RepID=A0A927AX57_9BACT|nr:LytTR family DNA-binding domain-containing protein [Spirosoma validum]MBD2751393.1 response regulator transcription factor [Spirosoma validum]